MAARGAVFIATSVDGYIARPDGGLDWLAAGESGEDFGYDAFMAGVDVLYMGRGTYETVRGFGTWPYAGRRVVVASRSLPRRRDAPPGDVEVTPEAPSDLFERLSAEGAGRVYVDGGRLITSCLGAGLVDEMTITRVPVLLGEGLPLFGRSDRDVRLEHVRTRPFASGLVQSTYRVRHEG